MNILIPQGIGDAVWALTKMQSVANKLGGGIVDVFIQHHNGTPAECRAFDFVNRFDFVRGVSMYQTPILKDGPKADERGIPNYIDHTTRLPGIDLVMVPNRHLDTGNRLETWLPEYETDWDVMQHFRFDPVDHLRADLGDNYFVFFLGSESGNTTEGHNRGPIWKPSDWVELSRGLTEWEANTKIVVVGAEYDYSYFRGYVDPILGDQRHRWVNLIGKTNIGETLHVTRWARGVFAYQSGIGMIPQYMGVPGGVFFRHCGDSLSPTELRTADDRMVSGWASPESIEEGWHLPLFYGDHGPEYIIEQVRQRGW